MNGNAELLTGKKFIFTERNPVEFLLKMQGVIEVDYYNMTSSAGRWTGIFVQKLEDKYYLIDFEQEISFGDGDNYIYTGEQASVVFDDLNHYETIKKQHFNYLDDLCSFDFAEDKKILKKNTKKEKMHKAENLQMSLFFDE